MEVTGWLGHNWFAVVQTGAILVAIAFSGVGLFFDARSHRVSNLIHLTDRHRLLWERVYSDPKLARILNPKADPDRDPVTAEENLFMIFFILHLANTFYTVQSGFLKQPEGLRRDVQLFLALPVPMAVWREVRGLQDRQFVKFVEGCLAEPEITPDAVTHTPQPRSWSISHVHGAKTNRRRRRLQNRRASEPGGGRTISL